MSDVTHHRTKQENFTLTRPEKNLNNIFYMDIEYRLQLSWSNGISWMQKHHSRVKSWMQK